ncbi:MAG: Uncharacterized protein G01um101418_661 [Parcubacteria group bacterium Gr01-1014_18]|nr:MAG: Uncharacterized protein Greene041636_628 [Parcubacteria group bacterium Greene0416_36]TSC80742.1 MAG: Uncharacterized protein G01um101418_661 [Parcubacteria group bacterium Gr01-1014_18]TSC98647.1 MAG: Uncharacterized protein Greene101420_606 [Parcubacteria group bacterium Greene1014_20]TSD07193.1 MAG: Uncharacterized protein Greene07142_362 [Parcubacteria group bacterium Greene0714_2]
MDRSVSLYRQLALTFAGLTLVVIVVVLYISVSYASITIRPKETELSVDFIETVSLSEKEGVAGRVLEINSSDSKKFESAPGGSGADDFATGTLTVYNKSSSDQILVPKTRFASSGGLIFRTNRRILVPKGGTVEVEVVADDKGEKGNVSPGMFSVPGLGKPFENIIYGQSSEAFSGGKKFVYSVTEQEIASAKATLQKDLEDLAFQQAGSALEVGESILREASWVLVESESVSAASGDNKSNFEVAMKVRVQVLISNPVKIAELAKKELYRQAGTDMEVIGINSDSLTFKLEKYDPVAKSAQIKISMAAKGILKGTSALVDKEAIKGKSRQELIDYFASKPGVGEVTVEFSPFWVRSVPSMDDHIYIVVQK